MCCEPDDDDDDDDDKDEQLCTAIMPPAAPAALDHFPCRLCRTMLASRPIRNTHEATCKRSEEANLRCKSCPKTFDNSVSRIFHQGQCLSRLSTASPSKLKWTSRAAIGSYSSTADKVPARSQTPRTGISNIVAEQNCLTAPVIIANATP